MKLAKISSKGQITLPAMIKRQLGLQNGESVAFIEKDGQFVLVNPAVLLFGNKPPASDSATAQPGQAEIAEEPNLQDILEEPGLEEIVEELSSEEITELLGSQDNVKHPSPQEIRAAIVLLKAVRHKRHGRH